MANFNILMFGSRRTGKSSILASMIDSFETVNKTSANKIKLKATTDTEELLKSKKGNLENIFEKYGASGEPFAIEEVQTNADYTYEFTMTAEGSKDSHTISFKDIPGEWLMTQEKKDEIDNEVSKSQIIIIAIDTPHLMEEYGDFNNAFNITQQVYNFLKNIKGEKDIPRMILFVPIKCEKYYHEGRMDEVNKEIKKQYKLLFDDFGTPPKKDLYTVAITPILTLGGVVFHDFLRDSEGEVETINNANVPALAFRPKMTYYKLYDKAPVFSPKHCEQPVLYLLNFILKIGNMTKVVEQEKSFSDRIIDGILTIVFTPLAIILGEFKWLLEMWEDVFKDRALIESAITAKEHIKTNGDGYEIVQNQF